MPFQKGCNLRPGRGGQSSSSGGQTRVATRHMLAAVHAQSIKASTCKSTMRIRTLTGPGFGPSLRFPPGPAHLLVFFVQAPREELS